MFHGPDGPGVRIAGAFDIASSSDVQDVLLGLLDGDNATVTVDLAAVHFMDSTGLRVLNIARKRADELGGVLILRHVATEVRRVIEILGLAPFFKIVDDQH